MQCAVCAAVIHGRADQKYCSTRCRVRAHRAKKAPPKTVTVTDTREFTDWDLEHEVFRRLRAELGGLDVFTCVDFDTALVEGSGWEKLGYDDDATLSKSDREELAAFHKRYRRIFGLMLQGALLVIRNRHKSDLAKMKSDADLWKEHSAKIIKASNKSAQAALEVATPADLIAALARNYKAHADFYNRADADEMVKIWKGHAADVLKSIE